MPQYDITAPGGQKYRVNAPEGASEQDALKYVQSNIGKLDALPAESKSAPKEEIATEALGIPALDRFASGLRDPIEGTAQLLTHALPHDVVADVNKFNNWLRSKGVPLAELPTEGDVTLDKQVQEREKKLAAERPGGGVDWARLAGNIANPINYAVPGSGAASTGGRLVEAAARGLAAGAMQPATEGDFGKEKTNQALWGAAFGPIGELAAQGAAKVVAPTVKGAKKALMEAGVELTPGQIAGSILRRAEEAAKSFPILGSFIRGAEGRSMESFNRAAIDQALEPAGIKLPSNVNAGREAIGYAQGRLGDAYDALLPKMTFSLDQQFANDVRNLTNQAGEMPPAQFEQFKKILMNRVAHRLQGTGSMDGAALKQVESELGHIASNYSASSDAAQRELGHSVNEIRNSIRQALARQNPAEAADLQKLNRAWAMFTRVQNAAARRVGSGGIFTPTDLLQAVKSADKSVRKGDFARGDALMQEFAEFGQMVLPAKMPDSGTTERAIWDMLGLGAGFAKPEIPMALGAASVPYTAPATKALNAYMLPGQARQRAGQAISGAATYAAPAAADVATQLGISK